MANRRKRARRSSAFDVELPEIESGSTDFEEGLPDRRDDAAPVVKMDPSTRRRRGEAHPRGEAGNRYRSELNFDEVEERERVAKSAQPSIELESDRAPEPVEKQAPHAHVFVFDAGSIMSSAVESSLGQQHTHTVAIGGASVETSSSPGGPGHTHTVRGVKSGPPVAPKSKTEKATKIQTLIFSKETFSARGAATKWARDHDFRADKVDETANSFRLRQAEPSDFVDGSFRTIDITDGVKAVIGTPKGKAAAKKTASIPDVLSWEAVRAGAMPAHGTSGLPESLEGDVPPAFRYWKCSDPEDARRVRDALVEERIFDAESIRIVDGVPRLTVTETVEKVYLTAPYDESEPVQIPPDIRPIEKAAAMLRLGDPKTTLLFDSTMVEAMGLETILERVDAFRGDWVVELRDSPEVRKSIERPAFRIPSRDDLIYATNADLNDPESAEWVVHSRDDEVIAFAFGVGRTIKLIKAAEERTVFGVVLEPDEVDTQNDTISREEIQQAAHKFMEDFQNLGLQHQEIVNGRLKLLESYIAPVAFEVGKEKVKEGSWLMKERVVDDDLWNKVKKGEFTGFSIGGSGVRRPT